jgi:hypothetical protein
MRKRNEGLVAKMISLCEESSSSDEEERVYFICLQNYKTTLPSAPNGNFIRSALIAFQTTTLSK